MTPFAKSLDGNPNPGHVDLYNSNRSDISTVASILELIKQTKGNVRVACDTEFQGPHTLTAQFATRIGNTIVGQIYHSPAISPPEHFNFNDHLPDDLKRLNLSILVRPFKKLERTLSPVQIIRDLFGIQYLHPESLLEVHQQRSRSR